MAVSIHTPSGYINPNQTEGAVWYILLYNFLITHLSFMKFGDFLKFICDSFSEIFFQNSNWFLQCQHFSRPGVIIFVCLLLEKWIYPSQY